MENLILNIDNFLGNFCFTNLTILHVGLVNKFGFSYKNKMNKNMEKKSFNKLAVYTK